MSGPADCARDGRPGTPSASAAVPGFPFAAVVGHDDAKLALLLDALDRRIGGVLLRGEKGSAKSTLARGLGALLGEAASFVELPVSATEDRVVGSLDVGAALVGGGRRFQPGLLAAADGGVLYVDEVNLLPDHLVDVVLDAAASGVNRVEREGLSESHPSRFVLVGSMNPEEGELRPQLLDRFGFAVEVTTSTDPAERAEAVARRLAFDADPAGFAASWADAGASLAARLAEAAARIAPPGPELLATVSRLCATVGAEGLRADLVIARGAAALAAWEGREAPDLDDVAVVAPLALGHRRRRGPFDQPGIDPAEIAEALGGDPSPPPPAGGRPGTSSSGSGGGERADSGPPHGPAAGTGAAAGAAAGDAAGVGAPLDPGQPGGAEAGPPGAGSAGAAPVPPTATATAGSGPGSAPGQGASRGAGVGPIAPVVALAAASGPGRRSPVPAPSGRRSPIEGPRGRVVGAQVPRDGPVGDVALGATLRAAAQRSAQGAAPERLLADATPGPIAAGSGSRSGSAPGSAPGSVSASAGGASPRVEAGDLRQAVREQLTGNLVVIALDASASMGAEARMEAVKGAVLSLLLDAYQRRDRVALVSFAGEEASVVLRPTGSVEVARARLAELRTGGRTPLAAGIDAALGVATGPGAGDGRRPMLVVVSDGRATAGPGGVEPLEAARVAAARVRAAGVPAVVVDVEDGPVRLGLALDLAEAMGAVHLGMAELTGASLAAGIRVVAGGARR